MRKIIHAAVPLILAMVLTATAAAVVFAVYYTEDEVQWISIFAGMLVALLLVEAARLSHPELVVPQSTEHLTLLKGKLEREMLLRKKADEENLAVKPRLLLIDEVLPTMVAFIDIEGRCQYHNRAFKDGLHLRPEQIRGKHIREVLGTKVYQETAAAVRQSLDGHPVRYERTQTMSDGTFCRFSVEHIPQFGENGKVNGFHILINDITSLAHIASRHEAKDQHEHKGRVTAEESPNAADVVDAGKSAHGIHVEPCSDTGHKDINQIIAAIGKGKFRLLYQLIAPIKSGFGEIEHFEILVRLIEEEENLIPPGEFFPLAEKYGLMMNLDRWVVQHVVEHASRHNLREKYVGPMYFINLSVATISDPEFPEFTQLTLLEHGLPGAALCFEIPNAELVLRTSVVAEFARRIRQYGCRVAISGFGSVQVSFDYFRGFQVEFLKIDGSIVFDILRDPAALAKIRAINNVAQKIGVETIAELVESEETITKLKEIGIDYAQGFGISRPRPLEE